MPESAAPAYITSLIRHFEDLRDGTHGGSAYFGGSFHHPHLRGTTVHDWPLNVFSDEDAADQLSILRAIASSDLHNLVYRADYRIVPAVTINSLRMRMTGKLGKKRPYTKMR